MKELTTLKTKLENELKALKDDNNKQEGMAYKDFNQDYTNYQNSLISYDDEMNEKLAMKAKEFNFLKDQKQSLAELQELWQERLNERRKREELDMLIKKKKEEQEKEMVQQTKAAEWVQAHWRGLVARKEYEKSKKSRKKRKNKKGKK